MPPATMTVVRTWTKTSLIAVLVALVPALALAPKARATTLKGIHKIQHVVVIMQENRSFDSYFGTYQTNAPQGFQDPHQPTSV